jgi:uncharacterized membrane protein
MLGHFTTAVTLAIVHVNLIALALLAYRVAGHYTLSRVASPLVLALAAFFTEHFVGFGPLSWCWPLTTAASLWIVFHDRAVLRTHWRVEATLAASFAWVFAWRFSYPGLVASSEKIGDLAMIVSYLPGERLPPTDAWLPPYPFNIYYSFQHYAAALLGRIFDLDPGLTYNFAFCLLVSLTIACAAAFAYTVCGTARSAAFVAVAFAAGGTGASLPVHLMLSDPQLHSSMRFIGGTATPARVDTAIGRAVVRAAEVPADPVVELPAETFAYLASLGDYHPPLSGFYLLALALLCVALIERGTRTVAAQAVLAATPVLCMIANGWTLPLQVMLVIAWIVFRLFERRPPDWRALAVGFAATSILCQPFLSTFAYEAGAYAVRLRLVPPREHTPPLLGLLLLYPLVIVAVPALCGERRRWLIWLSGMWVGMLLFSELFYIDDAYSGRFNRFNTTLKWWPWIQAGALLTAGASAIGAASRIWRYAAIAMLLLVSVYAVDLTKRLLTGGKVDFGQLDGAAWITSDRIERAILAFLKAQPPVIVLQRPEAGAFTPAPGLVLLAGQTAFLGWVEHEKLWRGRRADVELRAREVAAFYAGEMEGSAQWLLENRIDHVLWLKTEDKLPSGTFGKIDEQIRGAYFWREYYRAGEFRVGIWSRRSHPAG